MHSSEGDSHRNKFSRDGTSSIVIFVIAEYLLKNPQSYKPLESNEY